MNNNNNNNNNIKNNQNNNQNNNKDGESNETNVTVINFQSNFFKNGQYETIKKLGSGSFGTVFLVLDKHDNNSK